MKLAAVASAGTWNQALKRVHSMPTSGWSRTATTVLYVALIAASCLAADYVGSLVGWLIGASASPLAKAIAPLVFGLLGAIGVRAVLVEKHETKRKSQAPAEAVPTNLEKPPGNCELLRTVLAAVMVAIFCRSCYYAIPFGIFSRIGPYKSIQTLLGHQAADLDVGIAADLYAFRLRARAANISYADYESFMTDVIRPVLTQNGSDKLDQVRMALTRVELGLPLPTADVALPSEGGVPNSPDFPMLDANPP